MYSCRRFVGVVFGSKGTDAILSVENFCCDRPNPILQVFFLKKKIFVCIDIFDLILLGFFRLTLDKSGLIFEFSCISASICF